MFNIIRRYPEVKIGAIRAGLLGPAHVCIFEKNTTLPSAGRATNW